MSNPTYQELAARFVYDPLTGIVRRVLKKRARRNSHRVVGTPTTDGYLGVIFKHRKMRLHRLIWTLHTGQAPLGHIDHINGVRTDNRIANLRDVPQAVNNQNIREPNCRNRLGIKGVQQQGRRFRARIRSAGETIYLGMHATAELAHAAYIKAKRELHEGCTL